WLQSISRSENMNIGFIGLGVMGAPMAKHLVEAGHNVIRSLNRSALPPDLTNAGVRVEHTPAEVARLSELIITMLPNTPDVDHVLFGENGVAGGLSAGKIVVDMSSISPTATESFAARVEALGCGY